MIWIFPILCMHVSNTKFHWPSLFMQYCIILLLWASLSYPLLSLFLAYEFEGTEPLTLSCHSWHCNITKVWAWFRIGWWSSQSSTDTRGWATNQTSLLYQDWTRETGRCYSRNIPSTSLLVSWTLLMEGERPWSVSIHPFIPLCQVCSEGCQLQPSRGHECPEQ